MEALPSRPQLVAVDTNVLFNLADEVDDTVEAVALIQRRLAHARLILPPTVQHEVGDWARREAHPKHQLARKAIALAATRGIEPASLLAVGHGIAEQIALRLRERRLLPDAEVNDSLVLAESALLECSLLLTGDEHLRGMDFQQLTFELQRFDLAAPVIATPREVVRKFFH
ncbi:MAG: type II toxin-antitoxin system VapC family toxin [Pedosphaera sp.]|nr:type II toxin-antitoxin system VapC family toxin [Pedosphaera sp.]